jgi:hypothetical protein
MKSRSLLVVSSAIVASLTLTAVGISVSASATTAHTPARIPVRCETFDVTGQPKVGMPWDEPVTFCAPGMRAGDWTCRSQTPAIGPGTRLYCTKARLSR